MTLSYLSIEEEECSSIININQKIAYQNIYKHKYFYLKK